MPGLYILSTRPRAGKTLLACGLGVMLRERGLKTGYMKPLGAVLKRMESGNGDAAALLTQEVLGQEAGPEDLTPVMPLPWDRAEEYEAADGPAKVKEAYARIAKDKDLVLVSGTGAAPVSGCSAGVGALTLTRELDLRVLLVERCEPGFNFDSALCLQELLGARLAGVIINDASEDDLPRLRDKAAGFLEKRGLKLLGLLAHEPRLNSVRVLELAHALKARIAAGNSRSSNLAEGFVIGSMQVENFLGILASNPKQAAMTGGDRTDLQLAALRAGVPCLILTGNMGPHDLVRAKAEERGIPVLVSREDSFHTARRLFQLLGRHKFHDLCQIRAGVALVKRSLDLELLLRECHAP